MGLDFGFYRQDNTEVIGFRNHSYLFFTLSDQPLVTVEPYDDFYVTRPMVLAVLAEIEKKMRAEGLPVEPLQDSNSDELLDPIDQIPEEFYWSEPEDFWGALAYYRILLAYLLREVRRDGCLICGWSA